MRVGLGYDIHRTVAGRRLMLGGVEIAHELGLEGHSDADVVLHALMDALLGAASLGDIGQHFPPHDIRYRGASSVDLLGQVQDMLTQAGFATVNVDIVLVAERPRIAQHSARMREIIGATLGISTDRVGLKATTNEGMGPEGEERAMSARAVALVERLP